MEITRRTVGEVSILELKGRLTIGEGDVRLREALLDVLEEGARNILIDLGEVKTIDSSGLGELIRCRATAARNDGEIKLLRVNIKARRLLTMAQLIGVFEMFDDETLAVASFEAEAEDEPPV